MPECEKCLYADTIEKHTKDIERLFDGHHENHESIGLVNQKLDTLTATTNDIKTMLADFTSQQRDEEKEQIKQYLTEKNKWKWTVIALAATIIGGVIVTVTVYHFTK